MDYINRLSAAYTRWIDWLERWLTPSSAAPGPGRGVIMRQQRVGGAFAAIASAILRWRRIASPARRFGRNGLLASISVARLFDPWRSSTRAAGLL